MPAHPCVARKPSGPQAQWPMIGINETGHSEAVKQVADEPGAADHRAGSDGGAGVGEGELEQPESEERDAGGLVGGRRALQRRTSA